MSTLGSVAFGVVSFFLQFQFQFEYAMADRAPPASVKIHVTAVGTFGKGFNSCVAFWFDTGGSERSVPYIMTNGHCIIESTDPQIIENRPDKYMHFWFRDLASFKISDVDYATVDGSDFAILHLNSTYGDLRKLGMLPLKISEQGAKPGMPVIEARKPEVGYACLIEALVPLLKEGRWLWQDSSRYRCYREHGNSGSPVISTETGEVVAIHNTGGAMKADCSTDNPCEVDAAGNIFFKAEFGYAQRITAVLGCFDKEGNFDVKLPSCHLKH